MSDLICRNTMMRCQTPGMCSPYGGCRETARLPVQVISVEAPGLKVEKDIFGTVHIKLEYAGGDPFDFVQIRYDHRFTSNSHQNSLVNRIVAAITGVDPERDQLKAEVARSTEREIMQLAEIEVLRKALKAAEDAMWKSEANMDSEAADARDVLAAMGKGEKV